MQNNFSRSRITIRVQNDFDKMLFSSEFALAQNITQLLKYKVDEHHFVTKLKPSGELANFFEGERVRKFESTFHL